MADFNNIYVNSSLTVVPANFASLCFNDGILISKSKYTVTNNILDLLVDTKDTVSIFSNNGIANTYEFDYIRLNIPGVTLPSKDANNKLVEGLTQNKVLVFVDGKLQPSSAYTVVNKTTLKFNINYTNDYNKLFNVIVYSSTVNFQRISYTKAQIQQQYDTADVIGKEDLRQNRFTLPIMYEHKNTAIFINEHKVDFNAVDVLDSKGTSVQLNIPESLLTNIDTLEVIKFTDNSTSSINFTTRQGYLEYGPYDDLGKKLPNTYDVIFKFTDQVKLLIDNIRTGFILKEVDGYGEALIVDTDFESMEMKGLLVQPFPYSNYVSSAYYLNVPEYTNIVKYLAEFDRKYTFLPEILRIFQRLLLDDINDTVQRLREARSISKVDSVHINKLIRLLGFDINIKQLNKKQRRELIEELNEFYRIAGTRNSYNLINILQNNLKLISAEQLFTPAGMTKSKQTLYNYTVSIDPEHQGTGYQAGDALALENTGLVARVNDVDDQTGAILALELETSEGYNQINDNFTMTSVLNGTFKATSTPNLYRYAWALGDTTEGLSVNMDLYNATKTYGVHIDSIVGDQINFTPYAAKHKTDEDKYNVNFNKLQLYRMVDDITASITTTPLIPDDNNYGEPVYTNIVGGAEFNVFLRPGTYYVEASGAGGAGGAADSTTGNEFDIPAYDGSAGELKTAFFTLTEAGTITGKVGQGGGAVKARGHDRQPYNNVLGNGFNNGTLGELRHISWGWIFGSGNIAGGQGGGSTGIYNPAGETIFEAKGGNGGGAQGKFLESVKGGIGGGGGTASGTGAAGGSRAYGGTFWSKPGADGWIKIYRVPLKYNLTISGDTSGVGNEVYTTIESGLEKVNSNGEWEPAEFTITAHVNEDTHLVTFELEPIDSIEEVYSGCTGTFNLKKQIDSITGKLSVASTVSLWDYHVRLNADPTHITKGSTFINSSSPASDQFVFTVNKDYTTEGTWTPMQGTNKITLDNASAYTRQGQDAIAIVKSDENLQKNQDRCYIDFYKKEELFNKDKGEGQWIEFRPDYIGHGTITEGTPNSPRFWEVGEPDIVYGSINDEATEFIEYGTIDEATNGEWVEWWKWDRNKIWYPTNHVDLEMKLPPGVNFSEYIDTFIEQFYNLASTVVFIHQITESFYFGNDTSTSYNTPVSTQEDLIGDPGVMAAPFGIVSTAPTSEHELIITSDPNKQYINPIGDDYDVTIIPEVPNATVSVITESISNTGQVIQTVTVLTAAENWTTQVKYGTTITYKVEASGYITKAAAIQVTKSIVKHVVLKAEQETTPKYCRLSIQTLPQNATVTYTVNNVTTTASHTIYAWEGNTVNYSISYPGYVTQHGTIVLTEDTDLIIQLEKAVLFTIRANPVDAQVIITINGKNYQPKKSTYLREITGLEYVSESDEDPNYSNYITEIENQIYVPINQEFSYTVSKYGYESQSDTISVTENTIIKVKLNEIV